MTSQDLVLTAIISTIRHGEKDNSGALTDTGFQQGAQRGKSTRHLKGDVVLLHSGVNRVKETLISFAKYIGMDLESEESFEERTDFNEYISHYLQYLYDAKNKGTLFGTWDDVNGVEAEHARMVKFLNLKNTSTEPAIYPSPKHMAIRLARLLSTEIDFATITVPEVMTNFVNGTHEPVIMSFLYYFLQDFVPQNEDFVTSIGGTVGFCEGFDIFIYQTLKGSNKVVFKFRDFEREVDQVKLKEFCLSENV